MTCQVYADNAATTRLSNRALAAMQPWLQDKYGNPSSVYTMGREARRAVEAARVQLAQAIGAQPGEIYFTSCGTEANNWALKGIAQACGPHNFHMVTTTFEHHAVLNTCRALERCGYRVTYLPVNPDGLVCLSRLARALERPTALVSVMFANNEIGTVQPVQRIGELCRTRGAVFHTDAVQAVGHLPIDVNRMNIDLLTLSAHKFHGPKGVGALYIRKGAPFPACLLDGGGQERERRSGTENVAGIVGLGAAVQEAMEDLNAKSACIIAMRERLIDGLLAIPGTRLNGHPTQRLPGNVNVSFTGVDSAVLLAMLDKEGVCVSTGSACSASSAEPSHVLKAIGLPKEYADGTLRLTLGAQNSMSDVCYLLERIGPMVRYLRGTDN